MTFEELIDKISDGNVLCVPHRYEDATLFRPTNFPNVEYDVSKIKIPRHDVDTFITSPMLFKLTENRIGDNRSYRMGWRDLGLDGSSTDFYVMTQ